MNGIKLGSALPDFRVDDEGAGDYWPMLVEGCENPGGESWLEMVINRQYPPVRSPLSRYTPQLLEPMQRENWEGTHLLNLSRIACWLLGDRGVVGLGSRATDSAQQRCLFVGNRGMADPDGGRTVEDAYDVVGVQHLTDVAPVSFLADAQDIHE